jgi:hypothetical protein
MNDTPSRTRQLQLYLLRKRHHRRRELVPDQRRWHFRYLLLRKRSLLNPPQLHLKLHGRL